ncbi:hypothetical protein PGT21_036593 [Puccinia graminis f. sp. tritici]|uniref:Tet-like 2OG-Fe(II) oxygenase domain-containing protein n=1 Tax=Puccinia graminis f. sp. tritici TaxID=56615 RepID=A0A5B0R3F6_PUCGR|nr:hypothetical protein PGTUg99_006943 [Puccinia graminis f. sp. tritici]KAA1119960.1 hypothetical protein PGT21_036593 [Puccinia graminis f. sp. tritici]
MTSPLSDQPQANLPAGTNQPESTESNVPEAKPLPVIHHQPETETSVATDEEEVNVSIETIDKPKTKRKRKRHFNECHRLSKKIENKAKRRRTGRDNEFQRVISTASISGGFLIREERVIKADLFPEISKELAIEKEKKLVQEREADDQFEEERSKAVITPRAPTEEENEKALKLVQERFYSIYRDYSKIYNSKNGQIICGTEFQKIPTLEQSKREELDFLCAFIHDCKQLVSPVTPSDGLACENITSAIGWSKDTTRLEILAERRRMKNLCKRIKKLTPN